ncbi:hypothetical protein PT277_06770 [Acetobacteraceae bacterium ESL0709]|nr:hypothetical protein [Acetobacteraceae bacterium ESL0709]
MTFLIRPTSWKAASWHGKDFPLNNPALYVTVVTGAASWTEPDTSLTLYVKPHIASSDKEDVDLNKKVTITDNQKKKTGTSPIRSSLLFLPISARIPIKKAPEIYRSPAPQGLERPEITQVIDNSL